MKSFIALLAVAAFALTAAPAEAKGCLKGAAVGGVAGHYAGHTAGWELPPAASTAATAPGSRNSSNKRSIRVKRVIALRPGCEGQLATTRMSSLRKQGPIVTYASCGLNRGRSVELYPHSWLWVPARALAWPGRRR